MNPTPQDPKNPQDLFKLLDSLTDLEFDTDLEMKDIEALAKEEPNTYHLSDYSDCLCHTCLRERLEHWQQLMELQKMVQAQINRILEI